MPSAARETMGVLVDRDGTMIRQVGHLSRLEQVEILPRVPAAIRLLRDYGLKVAVVTNQSAVARGLLSEEELERIHQELKMRLAAGGAPIDGIYYCPHHPTEGVAPYRTACGCRKPNVGLATRAAAELEIDLLRSYVVGDQATDMEFAARLGAKGIFIQDRRPQTEDRRALAVVRPPSSVVVRDLWEAARWITQHLPARE